MTGAVVAADRREERAGAACPYRGLVPFSVDDADYFFGRGAEREIIAANLIASRLTLLYAASGVGKSSVLLAGVVHDLVAMAAGDVEAGVAPEYVPVVVRRWREDPLGAVRDAVRAALGAGAPAGGSLTDDLAAWTAGADTTVLLILDQFEEFLLYHGDRWESGAPAEQIARLLSAPRLPLNVLIALREDALAGLDRFKGRVPHLFENYLRLKHLDRTAAREAVELPIAEWNRRHGEQDAVTLEPALVDAVLDQLGEGVALARGAGQGQTSGSAEPEIEAPFLQLVLMRVWEDERAAGSHVLRAATLDRLGGADRIVGTYLDDQMDRLPAGEQAVASAVFHQLVTPSGTKIAHSLGDLADYTRVPAAELHGVLDKLSAGDDWRILRSEAGADGPGSRTYEIFHDVLAEAVLDWRGRFEEQRAATEAVAAERARRRRRLVIGALGLGVAAAILLVIVAISLAERAKADRAREAARSARLVGTAQTLVGDDPELAILLARRAGLDTPGAAPALRAALTQYGVRGVLPSRGGPVHDVDVSPSGKLVVGAYDDGHIRLWDVATQRLVADRAAGERAMTGARFSPDGGRIASTARSGEVRTWRAADGAPLELLRAAGGRADSPRWSVDGRRLVARTGTTVTTWDAVHGRLLREFGTGGLPVVGARWGTSSREVAIATGRGLAIRAVATGRTRLALSIPPVSRIRVNEDGTRLVALRGSRTSLVDLRTGRVRDLAGASFPFDAEFAPTTDRLAVATDRRVRIYTASDGRLVNILSGAARVGAVRFSADERTVLTAGADRTVRVWDIKTGNQIAGLSGRVRLTGLTAVMSGSAAGRVVITGRDGAIRLWQAAAPRAAVLAGTFDTTEARFVPGGGVMAAGFDVRTWDDPAAPSAHTIATARHTVDAGLRPGGAELALATDDLVSPRAAQLFDLRQRRELLPPLAPASARERPVAVAYSPDGRTLATADADGAASLWSAADHTRRKRLGRSRPESADRFLGHVAFTNDGRRLALSDEDGGVRLLDVATGALVRSFRKLPAGAEFGVAAPIAVQPGGHLLAVGGGDGSARLYDLRTGAESRLPPIDSQILDLAFNPDGGVLATASSGGNLRLWDVASGRSLGVFLAARDPLWSVDISSDGAAILALDDADAVRVFACDVCGSDAQVLRAAERRVTRALSAAELERYDPGG